jgi:hypothetical protein
MKFNEQVYELTGSRFYRFFTEKEGKNVQTTLFFFVKYDLHTVNNPFRAEKHFKFFLQNAWNNK